MLGPQIERKTHKKCVENDLTISHGPIAAIAYRRDGIARCPSTGHQGRMRESSNGCATILSLSVLRWPGLRSHPARC
jgi:hypothetical protein